MKKSSKKSPAKKERRKIVVEGRIVYAPPTDPSSVQKAPKKYDKNNPKLGTPAGGIPLGQSWRSLIKKVCDEPDIEGVSRRERIIRRAADLAEAGFLNSTEFLADREEGKAAQPLTGPDGKPLNLVASALDKALEGLSVEALRAALSELGKLPQ